MALTQQRGALAQVQFNAQQAIANLANLQAATRNVQSWNAPAAPAPRQNPPASSGWSAPAPRYDTQSAVQQIVQRAMAINQQPSQQYNQVNPARNAVMNALALAQGGQPGRGPQQQPLNRLAFEPQQARQMTPQQESQLFDQQMQLTKAQADPTAWMASDYPARTQAMANQIETMRGGFQNPAANTRLQAEAEILRRMPQVDPRQLRGLTDDTIADLNNPPSWYDPLSSANPGTPPRYDPLSGDKAGTPRPITQLPFGQKPTSEGPRSYDGMEGRQPVPMQGTPMQVIGTKEPPRYDPLSGDKTGTALVTQEMENALNPQAQGGRLDDGGGGFLDTVGDALSGAGELFTGGWDALSDLSPGDAIRVIKEAASSTYEAFQESPAGTAFNEIMRVLDWPLKQNKGIAGEMFTQWANGETVGYLPGGASNPLNQGAALPIILIAEAWEQHDPGIRDDIIDASENGYSSPDYIAKQEAAGIDPATAPPQFTGDDAVFEMLIGKSDDLPPYVKYPLRILIEAAYDPLIIAGGVSRIGSGIKKTGQALKAAEGAGTGTKILGTIEQNIGRIIEYGAKLPDAAVEGPLKVAGWAGGKTGEVTGLLSTSTKGLREQAGDAAHLLDEGLTAGRAGMPDVTTGRAFDAEVQGVTPTSGPTLIPPAAAPSPAPAAPTPIRDAPAPSRAVTTADDPRFRDYATADEAEGAALSLYDDWRGAYGDTLPDDVLARESVGLPGISADSGMFAGGGFKPRRMNITKAMADKMPVGPDGYSIIKNADGTWRPTMSAETKAAKAGSKELVGATASRTATGPTLADVNTQIANLRDGAYPSMTPREAADEMTRLKTLRNDMRAGRVPSDGTASTAGGASSKADAIAETRRQIAEQQKILKTGTMDERSAAAARLKELHAELDQLRGTTGAGRPPTTKAEKDAAAAAGSTTDVPRNKGAAESVQAADAASGTKFPRSVPGSPKLNEAVKRAKRLAKEDREGLPKEVNKILGAQKPGEHEFSPIYGGNRPIDKIVTDAIDSKDPAKIAKAEAFVKQLDASVEKHLRPDPFYKTFKKGGAPIFLQDEPGFTDDFFELMTVLDPEADLFRQRVLANGIDKGALDDLAMFQFRVNHLIPMLLKTYPDEFAIDGMLGAIARIETKNFREESAQYLMARYLDTPNPAEAETILRQFLTSPTEPTIIADRIHRPYAHSIPRAYQTESLARLPLMREQWQKIKGQAGRQTKGGDGIAPATGTVGFVPPANTLAVPDGEVSARLRWRANKEGGQTSGNFMEIREGSDGFFHTYIYNPSNNFGWLDLGQTQEAFVKRQLATGWATQVDDFAGAKSQAWGRVSDSDLPRTPYLDYQDKVARDLGMGEVTTPETFAEFNRLTDEWLDNASTVDEVSDAPFREADQAAQFAGGLKQPSRSKAEAIKNAGDNRGPVTDEKVLAAIGEIKDAESRNILLQGNAKFTVAMARDGDRAMPAFWTPPGYVGPPQQWNLKDAVDLINEHKLNNPAFDAKKAIDEAGQLAYGLQPRRTAAELKSARKAAQAQGLDPTLIKDGTSFGEHLTATRGVRALDWFLRHYRSVRMFNPIVGSANRLGDVAGNTITMAVGGNAGGVAKLVPLTATNTAAYRAVGRDTSKLLNGFTDAEGVFHKGWAQDTPQMAEWGQLYPVEQLVGKTKVLDTGVTTELPPLNQFLANKNAPRAIKTLGSFWTSPAMKDMMVASEMTGRKLTYDRVVLDHMQRKAFPALKEYLNGKFPGQADAILKSISESAEGKAGKTWSGNFSPEDVFKATGDRQAERVWQREFNLASEKGMAEADHLFFGGRTTNADEIARRTLTFHYWMVRASVLYGRTLLRNPVLLSGFVKMYQEAQEISEEQGLPGWLSGMMKFLTIPGNVSGYVAMDPIGMLFPTFFMDAYSQEGNKFQALQNLLVPPLGGLLGALGLTQNVPDMTGTRTIERFIIDMGNFLKGEGVDLEAIPLFGQFINTDSLTLKVPTEEFTKMLIEKANSWIGKPFGDFAPFDRQANEQDQLFSIGEEIAIQLWGPDPANWNQEELAEAVHQAQYGDGEETWLSATIRAQFGREGAARAGMALVIPGGVVTRQEFRDKDMALAKEYWDSFKKGGATTKEGELAATRRSMATNANPLWVALNNEYYQIGTKEQQSQYSLYNDLMYNPEELNPKASIVVVNGDGSYTYFTMAQLAALSDDDRRTVVEAWAANTSGVPEAVETVRTGRDAFKAEHPDYADYSVYQKGVFDYEGGISQFRKDMADNPNFKAAEDAERKRLKAEGKSGAVLEAELDSWATGQAAFFAANNEKWKNSDQISSKTGPSSVAAMGRLIPEEEKDDGGDSSSAPKDPTVNDFWAPEKGTARLAEDYAQYEHDNAKMEQDFGPYWNEAEAKWEAEASTATEREELGIGDNTYVTPSFTDTMRRYEDWEEDHPGGSPEEFFDYMLQLPGFGKKIAPSGTKTTSLPAGGVTYTPGVAKPQPASGGFPAPVSLSRTRSTGTTQAAPKTTTTSTKGSASLTGGKTYPLSQEYGMTDFAATQIGPGGMYDYTSGYSKDGSHVGHMGLDIGTPLGTPLYAPVGGTVVQAGGMPFEQDDRYGEQPGTGGLRIELPNGDIVVMAHMQQITVNVGDTVSAGQPVGYSGTAGADPSDPGAGAHVHVEYRKYAPGQTSGGYLAVDPRTVLDL
jgi:hypothetical protein